MGDINHQFGIGEEASWATAVTPTRFLEFTSESLERRQNIASSNGIKSGRRYGGQGRRITRNDAGGTVNFEIANAGFGLLFKHLLGTVATSTLVTGAAYSHVFTPASLTGTSLTLQKGVQEPDGTVQAFTYPGSKVLSADFSIDQDGLLLGAFEFDSYKEDTATSLATASYATPTIFTYQEGALKIDSTTKANVRSVGSLKVMNNLLTQRYFLGTSGLKSEQTNVPFDAITGNLDVEFQNTTDFYDLFAADTSAQLDLVFTGDLITTGQNYTLTFTIADVRFEGETPKVGGPELVYQSVPFVGLDPSSGDAVTITYHTSDATP